MTPRARSVAPVPRGERGEQHAGIIPSPGSGSGPLWPPRSAGGRYIPSHTHQVKPGLHRQQQLGGVRSLAAPVQPTPGGYRRRSPGWPWVASAPRPARGPAAPPFSEWSERLGLELAVRIGPATDQEGDGLFPPLEFAPGEGEGGGQDTYTSGPRATTKHRQLVADADPDGEIEPRLVLVAQPASPLHALPRVQEDGRPDRQAGEKEAVLRGQGVQYFQTEVAPVGQVLPSSCCRTGLRRRETCRRRISSC